METEVLSFVHNPGKKTQGMNEMVVGRADGGAAEERKGRRAVIGQISRSKYEQLAYS